MDIQTKVAPKAKIIAVRQTCGDQGAVDEYVPNGTDSLHNGVKLFSRVVLSTSQLAIFRVSRGFCQ